MKKCGKCKVIKSVDCFPKDSTKPDGFDSYCKKCRQNYRNKNRDIERLRSFKWMKNNQDIAKARSIAGKAYKKRKECCVETCKNIGERHHIDYSKPLEVIWLCSKHHRLLHRVNRNICSQVQILPSAQG